MFDMKLEKPPITEVNLNYLQRIWKGEFEDFIRKSDEEYYYWDDLKYKKGRDLEMETPLQKWTLLKTYRRSKYEPLSFGKYGFNYFLSSYLAKNLHEFDLKLRGGLQGSPNLRFEKEEFLKNSLLEEAIASSQAEGATSTTEAAREMLKKGRMPRNESEQMIFNNLRAIQYISEFQDSEMNLKIILELHYIMTANTEAEKYSGDFRKSAVFVTDHIDGEIAHTPPHWTEVEGLMEELCDFINKDTKFIHPIAKASIIHFMIGFIHPFIDGNGRTARALFYWFLFKKGYFLVKNISISRVILESRTQYDKAFLKTEYDEYDLTYFIHYSVKNIRVAFEKLKNYHDKKLDETKKANIISYELLNKGLKKRQADLVGYLYLKPQNKMTLNEYANKHQIVRQTASKDMNELIKMGILLEDKSSKPYVYCIKEKIIIDNLLNLGQF
jgi:Fic family protein